VTRLLSWRLAALATAALALALALSACGSGGGSTGSTGGSESTSGGGGTTETVATKIKPPAEGKEVGTCEVGGCDVYENVDLSPYQGKTIGVLLSGTTPVVGLYAENMKRCIEGAGGKVDEVNLNNDFTKAPGALQGMVDRGDAAIADIAVEVAGYHSFLEEAGAKELPVMVWAGGTAPGTVAFASDEFGDGVADAEYIVKRYPEGGKVLEINNPIVTGLKERIEGVQYVFEQHPQFQLESKTGQEFSAEEGEKLTAAYLSANPEMVAAIGGFGEWALGEADAIERAGSEAIVVSADGAPFEYEGMERSGSPFVMTMADAHAFGAQLGCETMAVMLGGGKSAGDDFLFESKEVTSANLPPKGKWNEEPRKVFAISAAERGEG
jgi:ribose transport system substrate-binding protein